MVRLHWKTRMGRKWQVERERERHRNGMSLMLWLVYVMGSAQHARTVCAGHLWYLFSMTGASDISKVS